jgi:hypothetical protein
LAENRSEPGPADESSARPPESETAILADRARLEGLLLTVRETVHEVANALTEAQGYAELALLNDDLPANTRELLNLSMNSFATVATHLHSLRQLIRSATHPPSGGGPSVSVP